MLVIDSLPNYRQLKTPSHPTTHYWKLLLLQAEMELLHRAQASEP